MTEGAGVQALLMAQMPGVDDKPTGTFGGVRGLPGDMLRGGAMAARSFSTNLLLSPLNEPLIEAAEAGRESR